MSAPYDPPPAFAFSVSLAGIGSVDAAFQEISGIDPQVQVEDALEGGVNTYLHQVPRVTKHSNLALKRGYVRQASALATWAEQIVGSTFGTPVATQTLVVALLGPDGAALVRWTFADAWPVKWEAGARDGGQDVLTETLEFSYSSVTRMLA